MWPATWIVILDIGKTSKFLNIKLIWIIYVTQQLPGGRKDYHSFSFSPEYLE
jgi:hypothetical protein